jgi:hypothetical protein
VNRTERALEAVSKAVREATWAFEREMLEIKTEDLPTAEHPPRNAVGSTNSSHNDESSCPACLPVEKIRGPAVPLMDPGREREIYHELERSIERPPVRTWPGRVTAKPVSGLAWRLTVTHAVTQRPENPATTGETGLFP